MIKWPVNNSFIFVPLNINCFSLEGGTCFFDNLSISTEIIEEIKALCLEDDTIPIVFDFSGISIIPERRFCDFPRLSFKRPIVFQNLTQHNIKRLQDDGVMLLKDKNHFSEETNKFWIGSKQISDFFEEFDDTNSRYFHSYIASLTDALVLWNKTLKSTPVHATKYYDVRRLCIKKDIFKIIASCLAIEIKKKNLEFDYVISSSYTGSFLAVPISSLFNKPLYCRTDFGPIFSPEQKMEWPEGKRKRCLLVADVICMGTEVRTVQTFLSGYNSNLVACAAIAAYLPPSDLDIIALLNRNDLEGMGYQLSIPMMEESKNAKK